MKRILITGVSGFVGSSLFKYFSEQQEFVIVGHSRKPETLKHNTTLKFIPEITSAQLDEMQIDVQKKTMTIKATPY